MSKQSVSAKDLTRKWQRQLSPKDPDKLAWGVIGKLVDGLGPATRLPVDVLLECVRTRDVGGLFRAAEALNPQSYDSPAVLLQDRLAVESFKKYSFVNSPFNKREKALIRFHEAERLCCETNRRVKTRFGLAWSSFQLVRREVFFAEPIGLDYIVNHASRLIANCLGAFRPNEMLDHSRFGPGSTLCVSGALTTEYFKFRERCPTVSSGGFAYAEALLNHDPKWLAHLIGVHPLDVAGRYNLVSDNVAPELRVCDQNKVTFVPKNAKTERSIAIEPYFNLYFQLGVGAMIRKRLKNTFSIDLTSQKRNQGLARVGSVSGELSTIDFSMASDTIATEVVRLLIPPEWFDHLDRLRCREYVLEDQTSPYHKFSSMGNGFTFELETLIFAALAYGVCQYAGVSTDGISVFGDDVILPATVADLYQEICAFLGFRVNDEKSFISGPFRESCGEDFFEGQRVRPVFCEELGTVKDAASLSNRLLELNRSVDLCDWDSSYLDGVVDFIRGFIPRDVRQHVVGPPVEEYDTHLHTERIEELSSSAFVRWVPHLFSWEYPAIRFQATKLRRGGSPLALCLYNRLRGRRGLVSAQHFSPFHGLEPVDEGHSPLREKLEGWRTRVQLQERAPLEVTGREIGTYKLGTGLRDGLLGCPSLF